MVIDMSSAMNEKDLRPTRYFLTLTYAVQFIGEFFEQNPISQLGMVGMRDGIAVRISDMSGNPNDHITAVQKLRKEEPKGQASLENALEMSRAALFHAPSHGTREIFVIFGALHTADPGDIHRTIDNLVVDKIRARVIGLAAQVAICRELVSKTNNGDASGYGVVIHEQHFRELVMEVTTPPITYDETETASSLLMMGFPSRTVESHPSLCACHSRPSRDGYLCSRCSTKVCSLPSECPVCGLTLILSTHLARSYHHLFPLVNWVDVPWSDAWRSSQCFSCLKPFPEVPAKEKQTKIEKDGQRVPTTSSRYECTTCHKHFCIDCDLFAHEVVHNCPGCQSQTMQTSLMGETETGPDVDDRSNEANGQDDMEVDQ
jgi:transcription initiation factor TFIIH subunit 2